MTKITGLQEQDSIAREAARQFNYYRDKNLRIANTWKVLYEQTMRAIQAESSLLIGVDGDSNPHIIKACEQAGELPN